MPGTPLVMIAGGGTGGHVFPALAAARELVRMGARVEFIGTDHGFEAKAVPSAGYKLHTLKVRGIAAKSLPQRLLAVALIPIGFLKALALLASARPSVLLGVGGYASGPAVIAAWCLRVPIVLHEQNALPGATNRLAARFARKIAISFPITASHFRGDVTVTGNPVRREFFAAPPVRPRILVRLLAFGGSQGARILNQRLIEALPHLTGLSVGIVHQTGARDCDVVSEVYARSAFRGAVVIPFLEDMARELGTSDVVLARAGATTVAELAAAGRGAILVPFAAAAGGHQEANAQALASVGAAIVIREGELTAERLAAEIRTLVSDPARLVAMGARAKTLARPDAASALATLVLSVVRP